MSDDEEVEEVSIVYVYDKYYNTQKTYLANDFKKNGFNATPITIKEIR